MRASRGGGAKAGVGSIAGRGARGKGVRALDFSVLKRGPWWGARSNPAISASLTWDRLMCAGEPSMTAGNNQPNFKIDFARFDENRRKIPRAQLLPYAGQQVAFSADGTRVVAHGADHQALEGQLQALG